MSSKYHVVSLYAGVEPIDMAECCFLMGKKTSWNAVLPSITGSTKVDWPGVIFMMPKL